jgi:hypothetical protein
MHRFVLTYKSNIHCIYIQTLIHNVLHYVDMWQIQVKCKSDIKIQINRVFLSIAIAFS